MIVSYLAWLCLDFQIRSGVLDLFSSHGGGASPGIAIDDCILPGSPLLDSMESRSGKLGRIQSSYLEKRYYHEKTRGKCLPWLCSVVPVCGRPMLD